MIIGIPGWWSGPFGECQVCGEDFATEIINGTSVRFGDIAGFDQQIAIHLRCEEVLDGRPWEELPEGPLKQAYREASDEAAVQGD